VWGVQGCIGVPRLQETTVALCLGPYGNPRGGGAFFMSEVFLKVSAPCLPCGTSLQMLACFWV